MSEKRKCQDEELEVELTDLDNTEVAKSFMEEWREHNEHRYKVRWERIKENKNAENKG